MLISDTKPQLDAQEICPERNVYQVVWTFQVGANSQEEANQHIQETMKKFTEFIGWKQPEPLSRLKVEL
jgi:hypothetical protein